MTTAEICTILGVVFAVLGGTWKVSKMMGKMEAGLLRVAEEMMGVKHELSSQAERHYHVAERVASLEAKVNQ